MKLPDFTLDSGLNELRRAMGAPLREFVPAPSLGQLTPEEIERLSREGIDIPLDMVHVLEDGTLAYKNQRVVVYIRDVKQYRHALPKEEDLPRFHVSHCDKLQEMRENNRYQRYVVATRDTGIFQVNLKRQHSRRHEAREERLRVCQYCLAKLNWNDFVRKRHSSAARSGIVQAFTLVDYFARYGKTFVEQMPHHTEITAPLNEYTKEFKEIAESIKKDRQFRCDKCQLNLTAHRKYLHAHHINAQQSDNSTSNISILCIRCHAEQYKHGHLKPTREYKEFMALLERGAVR